MSSHPGAFQLLTSLRYDPSLLDVDWNTRANHGVPTPIMLLPFHVDRLVSAASAHEWPKVAYDVTADSLTVACKEAISKSGGGNQAAYKIRVLLSQDGHLTATATPLPVSHRAQDLLAPSEDPADMRTIYIDSEPTPSSIFTSTKTTHRLQYAASRARVGLLPAPQPSDAHIDVVLHTPDGLITETSIRNIAFQRDGHWITPHLSTGCLPGVMRRYLIETGRWRETEIRVDDIQEGNLVMTSNGVEGCQLGRVTRYRTEN